MRTASTRRSWRRCGVAGLVLVGMAALAGLSGPLFPFTPKPSDAARRVGEAADLDAYLDAREAEHVGVKAGLAKAIVWNDPVTRRKMPLAIAYLHGFSA